jgi:hypothetical protein
MFRHQVRPVAAGYLGRDGSGYRSRALRGRPRKGLRACRRTGDRCGSKRTQLGCAPVSRQHRRGYRSQARISNRNRSFRNGPKRSGPSLPRRIQREAGAIRRQLHGFGLQRASAHRARLRLRTCDATPCAATLDSLTYDQGQGRQGCHGERFNLIRFPVPVL